MAVGAGCQGRKESCWFERSIAHVCWVELRVLDGLGLSAIDYVQSVVGVDVSVE